jgi:hypothetical protein
VIDIGLRDHRRKISPHIVIKSRRTLNTLFAVEGYRNTHGTISLYVNLGERTYWIRH